jgi:hypothetical protein
MYDLTNQRRIMVKIQSKLAGLMAGVFFMFNLALPVNGLEGVTFVDAVEEVPYELAEMVKTDLLENLVQRYNEVSALSETEIMASLISEVNAQERSYNERLASIKTQNETLYAILIEKGIEKFKNIRNNLSKLSKDSILENLLVAQEQLTHLGVMNVLKGIVAAGVSLVLAPFFLVGYSILAVGAILEVTLGIVTLGLLSPIGTVIAAFGLFIAAGALIGIAGSWVWALEE